MSKIGKFLQEIKENSTKNKFLLWGLGLLGAILLIWPGSCPGAGNSVPSASLPVERDYKQQLQRELESILAKIEGAGKVTVMLTLDDEAETVYVRDVTESSRSTSEQDSQGGERRQVEEDSQTKLVIIQAGGQEQPVAAKVLRPQVRGVLVVATGADSPLVRERLIHAVQSVLGLPAYRITVQKGR